MLLFGHAREQSLSGLVNSSCVGVLGLRLTLTYGRKCMRCMRRRLIASVGVDFEPQWGLTLCGQAPHDFDKLHTVLPRVWHLHLRHNATGTNCG